MTGHEMIVTHDCDRAVYTPVCYEPYGADCRLVCGVGCGDWSSISHKRHRMIDAGECQLVLWLEMDGALNPELCADEDATFEIGRFAIRPVWDGGGYEWQRGEGSGA